MDYMSAHAALDMSPLIRFVTLWGGADPESPLVDAIQLALDGKRPSYIDVPKAGYLCDGSVQWANNQVRIRIALYDLSNREAFIAGWAHTLPMSTPNHEVAVMAAGTVTAFTKSFVGD